MDVLEVAVIVADAVRVVVDEAGQTNLLGELEDASVRATVGPGDILVSDERGVVDADTSYELRTSFPARILRDPAETLDDAKLTPSATLCVRARGLL